MPSLAHEKGEKDEDAQAGSTTAPHPISIKDRRAMAGVERSLPHPIFFRGHSLFRWWGARLIRTFRCSTIRTFRCSTDKERERRGTPEIKSEKVWIRSLLNHIGQKLSPGLDGIVVQYQSVSVSVGLSWSVSVDIDISWSQLVLVGQSQSAGLSGSVGRIVTGFPYSVTNPIIYVNALLQEGWLIGGLAPLNKHPPPPRE